jgi:hypothetical protein
MEITLLPVDLRLTAGFFAGERIEFKTAPDFQKENNFSFGLYYSHAILHGVSEEDCFPNHFIGHSIGAQRVHEQEK